MIHPQLLADCHRLGRLQHCTVLLNRNAHLPWFILVPETGVEDFLDLPQGQRSGILDECASISAFIKRALGYDKVNFAGLGNLVPQMHLHIIGRSQQDPAWPGPVWGRLPDGPGYGADQLTAWQGMLAADCGLEAASP